jgi:hypothetical protein
MFYFQSNNCYTFTLICMNSVNNIFSYSEVGAKIVRIFRIFYPSVSGTVYHLLVDFDSLTFPDDTICPWTLIDQEKEHSSPGNGPFFVGNPETKPFDHMLGGRSADSSVHLHTAFVRYRWVWRLVPIIALQNHLHIYLRMSAIKISWFTG